MDRVLASGVKDHAGKQATVQGWLHKKRLLGGLNFINLRDRSGLVQVVIQDDAEVEKLRGLQIGSILKITGKVVDEPRAPGGQKSTNQKSKSKFRLPTNRP